MRTPGTAPAETAVSPCEKAKPTDRACCETCLDFENQGARVRVCVKDPGAQAGIERVLPVGSRLASSPSPDATFTVCVVHDDSEPRRHRLYRGSALLGSWRRRRPLFKRLESALQFAVACNARSSLFVHAGVVGWRGRAILLPGRSMSGKSTLVAALVRAGAEYYSDEYALVDDQGRVHPYPRPLKLREPQGVQKIAPERVGVKPLRAALVVSTRYSEGERFEPQERRPASGMMFLMANTVLALERPRFALERLIPMARDATILEGRGEADEAAAWLLRHPDLGTPDVTPAAPEPGHGRVSKAR